MNKLRIIIGQGTATEVYRATQQPQNGYDTIIIGPRGLWAELPQTHRMGQTPELLQLPGQAVPAHTTASGRTEGGMARFLDVNTYQQGLLALARDNDQRTGINIRQVIVKRNRIQLDQLRVTEISPGVREGQLRVSTSDPRVGFFADQVILATGIGPQRSPPTDRIHGTPDRSVQFPQLMEGVEYLNATGPYAHTVAVYGGSATAAWVAAAAMERSQKLLWFTRPGGSEFKGCTLPGDRNYKILQDTTNLRTLANLQSIDYLPAKRLGGRILRRPMVKLTLNENGQNKICLVDQLVYSIGGDPRGAGSIQNLVKPALRRQLQPLLDQNRAISNGSGVLAIGTPNRSLIVIGGGAYNYSAPGLRKQAAPMASLPTAAQVPDGIAMVVASVQALNNYMPFKQDRNGRVVESNLNINLGNRDQLAVYLALYYPDLGTAATNEIVTRVIHQRSSKDLGKQFGISEAELQKIIQQYA